MGGVPLRKKYSILDLEQGSRYFRLHGARGPAPVEQTGHGNSAFDIIAHFVCAAIFMVLLHLVCTAVFVHGCIYAADMGKYTHV